MRVIDVAFPLDSLYLDPAEAYNRGAIPGGFYGSGWHEPLIDMINGSVIRVNRVEARPVFGLLPETDAPYTDPDFSRTQSRPFETKGYNAQLDFKRYGSLFEGYKIAGLTPDRPTGGADVSQLSLSSELVVPERELHSPYTTFNHWGADIPCSPSCYTVAGQFPFTRLNRFVNSDILGSSIIDQAGYSAGRGASVQDTFSTIRNYVLDPVGSGVQWTLGLDNKACWGSDSCFVRSLNSFAFSQFGFTVSYTFVMRFSIYIAIEVRRRMSVALSFDGVLPGGYDAFGGGLKFRFARTIDDIYTTYDGGPPGFWTARAGFVAKSERYSDTIVPSYQCFPVSMGYDSDDDSLSRSAYIESAYKAFIGLAPDLRGAAAISSADAILDRQSPSNYIEASAEFSSLLMRVEEIGYALSEPDKLKEQVLEWLTAPNGSFKKFLEQFARLWADLTLERKFGFEPTAQDIHEMNIRLETRQLWENYLDSPAIYKGRHSFVVSEIDNLTDVNVDIRSTLAFYAPDITEFVENALRLDSRGSLFTLSRAYNALAYTFLLDYAVKLGDRMRVAELFVTQLLLRLKYGVHVYLVRFRYPDPNGVFQDTFGDAPMVFGFARELSKFVADPSKSTRLNYMPPHLPNLQVLLALLVGFLVRFRKLILS